MKPHPIYLVAQGPVDVNRRTLGICIKKHRKQQQEKARRTIHKTAERARVSRTVLSRAEKGKIVGFDKLLRIFAALDLQFALGQEQTSEDGNKHFQPVWVQMTLPNLSPPSSEALARKPVPRSHAI